VCLRPQIAGAQDPSAILVHLQETAGTSWRDGAS
jgi:hypothetical protein